jgi:predicted PurR-regulated permease PerM
MYALMHAGGMYEGIVSGLAYFSSIFSVIIIGFVIAYVLEPAVAFLCKRFGLKRITAVGVVYILLAAVLAVIILAVLLEIARYGELSIADGLSLELENYSSNIDNIIVDAKVWLKKYKLSFVGEYINYADKIPDMVQSYIRAKISKLPSTVANMFLSVVVSFYMLKDKADILHSLKYYVSCLVPEGIRRVGARLIEELDNAFSGFIRGQLTDSLIIATIFSVGFSIIGVPFAVPIGIISGLFNVIPYLGAFVGFFLSVFMTLVGGEAGKALYTAILVVAVQQIDSIYIYPKVIGDRVKLSPLMIIIALAAAGRLFGIMGMFLSVPVVAMIKSGLDKICQKRTENE